MPRKNSKKKGSQKKKRQGSASARTAEAKEAKVETKDNTATAMDTTDTTEDHKEGKANQVESKEFERALEIEDTKPDEALKLFKQVVFEADPDGTYFKLKERALTHITAIYIKQSRHDDLRALLVECRPFFDTISKAKTAKIVRDVIEQVGFGVKDSIQLQTDLCEDAIAWCKREKRTFLRQRMQSRIALLYFQQQRYKDALLLIKRLLKDVKKFDDKLLMVEIELIESKIHHALENFPKAKGALTSARSAANAVYCPPLLQAEIDLQSGLLCAVEKDFKTAFSYYYEAFEGYNTVNRKESAVSCLKYMLLTKIMADCPGDVYSIVNGKAGIKYAGPEVAAMKAVADAYKARSIQAFEEVNKKFTAELSEDPLVSTHLTELKNKLLEQNLIRIIEPFERVQISHVAKLIKLDQTYIENKLSEMILDKKFAGILDQGSGDLIVFDDLANDKTYETGLKTIKELGGVVDRLYAKAKTLSDAPVEESVPVVEEKKDASKVVEK